jgi:hypothetical protein
LNDTQSPKTKVLSEHGEETIEEHRKPADFGQDETDHLNDDEKMVNDGPKGSCGLIWYGTTLGEAIARLLEKQQIDREMHNALNVITTHHIVCVSRIGHFEMTIDGVDIMDHYDDAAAEYRHERGGSVRGQR